MTQTERAEIEGRALLLYDGVCALCNGVVDFLMKHDKFGKFRYAPLQSALGREILARFRIEKTLDGVALLTDALTPQERFFQRSDAVQAALQLLGSPWHALGKVLLLVPRFLREFGYGIVARIRYRLFGRYDTCPLPPPEQRGKILSAYE
jgi:predicted DCC family thiol-disulfide oxidoreductase YuxK